MIAATSHLAVSLAHACAFESRKIHASRGNFATFGDTPFSHSKGYTYIPSKTFPRSPFARAVYGKGTDVGVTFHLYVPKKKLLPSPSTGDGQVIKMYFLERYPGVDGSRDSTHLYTRHHTRAR